MEKAVEIKNVSMYYKDTPKDKVLDHISLTVNEEDYLGIIGPNGGGKTSLIKCILGLEDATEGEILIYGKPVKESKMVIGYVPQFTNVDRRFPISVEEVALTGKIKPGLHPFFSYKNDDYKEVEDVLKEVGIYELRNRQISQLSGGEFQKLLIARALSTNPKILILDEPTASVDDASREEIYNLLSSLNKEKKLTIILITHDMMAVSSSVTKIACLNEKLFYHGDSKIDEALLENLYGSKVDFIAHDVHTRILDDHEGEKKC